MISRSPDLSVMKTLSGFGAAEARIAILSLRQQLETAVREQILGQVRPGPSTEDFKRSRLRSGRILFGTLLIVVGAVPVGHPFAHVPCHLIETKRALALL